MERVIMTYTKQAVEQLFDDLADAGVSMKKMAVMSGVTRATLSNWRNGHSVPSLEKYLQVQATINEVRQ